MQWIRWADGDPDAGWWPLCVSSLLSVRWIQRGTPSLYSFHGFCLNWFHRFIYLFILFDHRSVIKKTPSLLPLIYHTAWQTGPQSSKGIFSYVSRQSMKDQHQKQLLLTLAELELLDNAEELERWVISSGLLLLHAHHQHLNTDDLTSSKEWLQIWELNPTPLYLKKCSGWKRKEKERQRKRWEEKETW